MARSRRRTPVCGITTASSEKAYKVRCSRALRRATNVALAAGAELLPVPVPDYWGDKDGKARFDPVVHARLLRK
jgi:hypothetical protein